MQEREFSLSFLSDPSKFAVNTIEAHSPLQITPSPENQEISLNGSWLFHYATNPTEVNWDFVTMDYDCMGWSPIKVPAQIQMEGYDRPQYVNRMYPWDGVEACTPPNIPQKFNPVGSYVKYITLDSLAPRTFISFQGVETAFSLWVNGKFVGYSEDSYTPADFELTEFLVQGQNKIAVAVFKFSTGSWLEDQDFWRMSGIMRDVFLYTTPQHRIADYHFQREVKGTTAKVCLSVTVEQEEQGQTLWASLIDPHCTEVWVGECSAQLGKLEFTLEDIDLWSSETPNLYQLLLQYHNKDGELIQELTEELGFCSSEIVDGIWYINGKRLVICGVNRHDFSHLHGRAVTKEEMEWDVVQMKRHNINAVRTSHYPNQTYFYHLCNLYGVYVMDETNLETHGTWRYDDPSNLETCLPASHEQWRDIVVNRSRNMVLRDKNHPSIISWSLGNEAFGGENFRHMKNAIVAVDPSTPIHYEGTWHCRDFSDVTDLSSSMYTPVKRMKELFEEMPEKKEKPSILCEYSHAMGNSCGGLSKYMDLARSEPRFQGGYIWDYIDQALATKDQYGKEFLGCGGDFGDLPNDNNFCVNGLIFGDRTLPPKMMQVKNTFQPLHGIWTADSVTLHNELLFTNLSDYRCVWTVTQEGSVLYEEELSLDVSPQGDCVIARPKVEAQGEVVDTISILLPQDTLWEKKGYELMFIQDTRGVYAPSLPSKQPLRVENSELNLGVYGENFRCLFARKIGGMVSYEVGGRELITSMPKPNFWRPPTDNDKGNNMPSRFGPWKVAGLYCSAKGFSHEINSDSVKITYSYVLATTKDLVCTVVYEVFGDSTIKVTQTLPACGDFMPDIPEFSWMIGVNPELEAIQWYGYGPEDTYEDTLQGAKLDVFDSTVAESMKPYVVPQETGNKCGVRWMKVVDKRGRGIEISGETPLQVSALPYHPHQIEACTRPNRFPDVYESILRISERKMGIGGDDSWGAKILPEYLISSEEERTLCFYLRGI